MKSGTIKKFHERSVAARVSRFIARVGAVAARVRAVATRVGAVAA